MPKLLKVLFFILLLVTAGEVGYYILLQNSKLGILNPQNNNIKMTPFPTKSDRNLIKYSGVEFLEQYLIPELNASRNLKEIKYSLIKEETGNAGLINVDETTGLLEIRLDDAEGKEIITYHTKPGEIARQKFMKIQGNEKLTINYSDIKVGDKLTIISHYELNDLNESFKEFIKYE